MFALFTSRTSGAFFSGHDPLETVGRVFFLLFFFFLSFSFSRFPGSSFSPRAKIRFCPTRDLDPYHVLCQTLLLFLSITEPCPRGLVAPFDVCPLPAAPRKPGLHSPDLAPEPCAHRIAAPTINY